MVGQLCFFVLFLQQGEHLLGAVDVFILFAFFAFLYVSIFACLSLTFTLAFCRNRVEHETALKFFHPQISVGVFFVSFLKTGNTNLLLMDFTLIHNSAHNSGDISFIIYNTVWLY